MFERLLKKFGASEKNNEVGNDVSLQSESAAIPPAEQLRAEEIMAGKEIDPASKEAA